jgi:hypothetical protein
MKMVNTKSLIFLIDDDEIDTFVHRKVLSMLGFENILSFRFVTDAMLFLKTSSRLPQLILINKYDPALMNSERFMQYQESESGLNGLMSYYLKPKDCDLEFNLGKPENINFSGVPSFNKMKIYLDLKFFKQHEIKIATEKAA